MSDPVEGLSARDIKRQQIKLTQAKQEAKDTKTRKVYQTCLKQIQAENEAIIEENKKYMREDEES